MKIFLIFISLFTITQQQLYAQGDVPFITSWETISPNEQITIPVQPGLTYSYDIDWGDGQSNSGVSSSVSHEFAVADTYQISITGQFPAIYINNTGDKDKLVSVEQWGNIEWQSMKRAFHGASNMVYKALDKPDLSKVTDMSKMFQKASKFNGSIGDWDVSNITDMTSLFAEAVIFNQDISNWNMSNVIDMSYMFGEAQTFNQNIGAWDVSNVKFMYETFYGAADFNQDIGDWQVDSVIRMKYLFERASSFNQDIGSWNVSNVADFSYMFRLASAFNQNISGWDVSKATTMSYMFEDAVSFNQDISSWNIDSVGSMVDMLHGSGLSQYNYDLLLAEWSDRNVKSNVELGSSGLEYCHAEDARTDLEDNHDWTISDDSKNCNNAQPCSATQSNTWEGNMSNDWNDASNWDLNTVPSTCDHVIIPSSQSVTLSDDAECYSIDIANGSTVEVSNYKLIVWSL